jgi:hypothetical protein
MGTDKQGAHEYADTYERHFGHLRDRPIRLLEIGVGGYAAPDRGGESLRMWKEFFPFAEIVGIDIHDKSGLAEERITILQGDQSDGVFLADVGSRHGPFDIIVDDGSHVCQHVIASFGSLFDQLADDGIYSIEDLQTSYWRRGYGGSSDADRHGTSMTFLMTLVDGLNHAEFDIADYEPTAFDLQIKSLTFYHNLAFIQKGPNLEPSSVLPPHPRPARMLDQVRPAPPRPKENRRRAGPIRSWARHAIPKPIRSMLIRPIRLLSARIGRRRGRQ